MNKTVINKTPSSVSRKNTVRLTVGQGRQIINIAQKPPSPASVVPRYTPQKLGIQYQMTVLHNAVRSRQQLRANASTPLRNEKTRCMSQPLMSPAVK